MAVSPTLGTLLSRFVGAVESAAVFVAILLLVYVPGRFAVVPLLKRAQAYVDVDETLWNPFIKIVNAAFAVFGLYLAIPLSGLATTPTAVAALSAGATIAIGFASRDVLSNFVSGAFVVTDPGIHIGDWIEWNGSEGIVEDISFRVTRIHTFDNELITVPNSELTRNAVTNRVAKDRIRITHEFGIGYGDDIDEARSILVGAALDHDGILDRPAPTVRLVELADSAVVLRARFWVADPARTQVLLVRSEYVQAVKERFDAAGVEMPYPYRQLTGTVETPGGTPRSE